MKKTLKIGLIIIITIGLIYGLVIYVGVQGFLFAWLLNFMLMMCAFTFTETLRPEFTSDYYRVKDWERQGKIYEYLGINFFRKLLIWVGWEKLNKKANPVKNSIPALTHLEYRTKQSELGHLIIFFIVLGFSIFVAIEFGINKAGWLLILNIVLNLYPIFLQRYNRPRLNKALRVSKSREGRFQTIN